MVRRRPQHAVSKLSCIVLSSARSCRFSICPVRLSSAWLVSLVVSSPSGDIGPSVVYEAVDMPCPRPLNCSHIADDVHLLSLTYMLVILSLYVMLSLLHSTLVSAAVGLFCTCSVSAQVAAPMLAGSSTQELSILL